MKKLIIIAATFTACLGLCAAVWPQTEVVEETLAPPQIPAVTAPEPIVAEVKLETEPDLPTEKEKAATPQPEPVEELGAVPVPAPAEPTSVAEIPQLETELPAPQPTIELQPGDEVYIPGFDWVPYEGPNREHGLKQDLLGAGILLDYESCCTEKWLVSYYDTNHFLPMWS